MRAQDRHQSRQTKERCQSREVMTPPHTRSNLLTNAGRASAAFAYMLLVVLSLFPRNTRDKRTLSLIFHHLSLSLSYERIIDETTKTHETSVLVLSQSQH